MGREEGGRGDRAEVVRVAGGLKLEGEGRRREVVLRVLLGVLYLARASLNYIVGMTPGFHASAFMHFLSEEVCCKWSRVLR